MARLALVTGVSTGIGRACALHLAERGFDARYVVGTRKCGQSRPDCCRTARSMP